MTYRELAPILRLKKTGKLRMEAPRDAKKEMDDMVARLEAKGVKFG